MPKFEPIIGGARINNSPRSSKMYVAELNPSAQTLGIRNLSPAGNRYLESPVIFSEWRDSNDAIYTDYNSLETDVLASDLFLKSGSLSGSQIVSSINTELGSTSWQTDNIVQSAEIIFTNRTFISGNPIQILTQPGVNNFYDLITVVATKNLTAGYTVNFGSAELDFFIGAQLILADQGGLQLSSPGIRVEKFVFPNYSGNSNTNFEGIINQPLRVSTGSLTGGQGTIKIVVTYRIHSI